MTTGHSDPHGSSESGAAKTTRQGVAIVGFVLIAIIGMTIAVYAARFVPSALSGMASATAYVSSLFVPPANEEPEPEAPVLTPVEPETPVVVAPATTTPSAPVTPTTPVTPVKPVTPVTPTYYGSADLTVNLTAYGYCAGRTFVKASRVPSGADYGAQFTLTNVGTNIASGWRFMVETPDGSEVEGMGVMLLPSRSAVGTTCFSVEDGGELSVTVDSRDAVRESNERNNTDSEDFGGSSSNNDDISCDITASDRTIDEGDTITLRWETDGDIDDARINHGVGSVDEDGGSKRVSPDEDITYRLTVENDDGEEDTCSVSIEVDEN